MKNLQLKLDILEDELNLPIQFLSGKIHELVIHIPWTKLGSEPIVVTVNTMECEIAPSFQQKPSGEDVPQVPAPESAAGKDDVPKRAVPEIPGYMQGFVSRLKNNIKVQVNNLMFKYIQVRCVDQAAD